MPEPNQQALAQLMQILESSGILISLAACLRWQLHHERGALPSTAAQLQRRLDAFKALDADAQQAWFEVAHGIAGMLCMTLSMHMQESEQSKLWTPDKARGN